MSIRHAPATQRNRQPILEVLQQELPADGGLLLEIAAGTGEHAVYFSRALSNWRWQPTDPDPVALQSIAAWREQEGVENLLPPLRLDAASLNWPVACVDALLCVNMTHISPPAATEGLFAGAGRLLDRNAPLLLYGPFLEPEVVTTSSNLEFDAGLRTRDPAWGLRELQWIDELAHLNGLRRAARHAMPANNLTLVYRQM